MIAFCGLNCVECPAYVATQENDNKKRAEVARQWSEQFKACIKPGDINCDGCLSHGERLFNHCRVCKIRSCAGEKKLENCAFCEKFACSDLSFILEAVPEAKETLEKIIKR